MNEYECNCNLEMWLQWDVTVFPGEATEIFTAYRQESCWNFVSDIDSVVGLLKDTPIFRSLVSPKVE